MSSFLEASTVERLATLLRERAEPVAASPLVTLHPGGSGRALFCVPGAGGNVLYLHDLARLLGTDRPVYGLQAPGLDGVTEPSTRVEELASRYVAALRKAQPSGPYQLAGHSFGGWVAFEMAQQLLRAGGEIATLAILDSWAPVADHRPVGFREWSDARWLVAIAEAAERWSGEPLGVTLDALDPLGPEERIDHLRERLHAAGVLPPSGGAEPLRGLVQVFKANHLALCDYRPRELRPVPITLLRAAHAEPDAATPPELRDLLSEPKLGWDRLGVGPVELLSVPGDHMSMLAEPQVCTLAEQLRLRLES